MTRISILAFLTLVVFVFFLFISCDRKGNEKGENISITSSFSYNSSHNMGQDCFSCHKSGGQASEYAFQIAGTVYDSSRTNIYPNAVVKFYTGPNATGNLVLTLEVDKLGNFFTTNAVDWGQGLYPSVEGKGGVMHMPQATSQGSCNSCHNGNTNPRIWAK